MTTVKSLRAAREAGNFSRWDLARKLAISSQKLQRIEEGMKTDLPEGFIADYQQALRELHAERGERIDESLSVVGSA